MLERSRIEEEKQDKTHGFRKVRAELTKWGQKYNLDVSICDVVEKTLLKLIELPKGVEVQKCYYLNNLFEPNALVLNLSFHTLQPSAQIAKHIIDKLNALDPKLDAKVLQFPTFFTLNVPEVNPADVLVTIQIDAHAVIDTLLPKMSAYLDAHPEDIHFHRQSEFTHKKFITTLYDIANSSLQEYLNDKESFLKASENELLTLLCLALEPMLTMQVLDAQNKIKIQFKKVDYSQPPKTFFKIPTDLQQKALDTFNRIEADSAKINGDLVAVNNSALNDKTFLSQIKQTLFSKAPSALLPLRHAIHPSLKTAFDKLKNIFTPEFSNKLLKLFGGHELVNSFAELENHLKQANLDSKEGRYKTDILLDEIRRNCISIITEPLHADRDEVFPTVESIMFSLASFESMADLYLDESDEVHKHLNEYREVSRQLVDTYLYQVSHQYYDKLAINLLISEINSFIKSQLSVPESHDLSITDRIHRINQFKFLLDEACYRAGEQINTRKDPNKPSNAATYEDLKRLNELSNKIEKLNTYFLAQENLSPKQTYRM